MDWQHVTDEFAQRYYHWALHDFEREIGDEFPFLQNLHNRTAMRFIESYKLLDNAEARTLIQALVKRVHGQALASVGDQISAVEEGIATEYFNSILFPSAAEASLKGTSMNGNGAQKIDRKQLAERIKQELRAIFPVQPEHWGPYEWCYRIPMGDWIVQTYIDVGGGEYKLLYDHSIRARHDTRLRLKELISILSWFGITQQTTWEYIDQAEIIAASRSLALLCAHFVQSVPQLLPNL